jgi:hypothetical protein
VPTVRGLAGASTGISRARPPKKTSLRIGTHRSMPQREWPGIAASHRRPARTPANLCGHSISSRCLDDFLTGHIPGTEVPLGMSRRLFAPCERLHQGICSSRGEPQGFAPRSCSPTPSTSARQTRKISASPADESFTSSRKKPAHGFARCSAPPTSRVRQAGGAIFCTATRSRSSNSGETTISSKPRRPRPTWPPAGTVCRRASPEQGDCPRSFRRALQ